MLDVRDVLLTLGVDPPGRAAPAGGGRSARDPLARALLDALAGGPAGLDELAVRTGGSVGAVATALQGLRAAGLVALERGWWCHRAD